MEFLIDLDNFFCEHYTNYDLFCGLPQYKMPTMYKTEKDEYGRNVSYSLPKTHMRLSKQENKEELLLKAIRLLTQRAMPTFALSHTPPPKFLNKETHWRVGITF